MRPLLISTRRFGDQRGWFTESYNQRHLASLGIDTAFVQDNHSYSAAKGTVRGLHFQTPPHGQAKLVRCLRGAIWDVIVDVRAGSPTYGKWMGAELSADNGDQLYVPVGYAHGFITLTDDAEVAYKTSNYYAPDADGGVRWDDPDIGIVWPLDGAPTLSDKDKALPMLKDWNSPFDYNGQAFTSLTA